MMLVYGEYEGYEKKGGKWVKEKRSTCRWEWLSVEKKIRRSIRVWVPKEEGQDLKDGEFEQWPLFSQEELKIRELALADALDPDAPLHSKIVEDYKKQKAAADEEEAEFHAQEIKKKMKKKRRAEKDVGLQKKLNEKEKELAAMKGKLNAKSTDDSPEVAQLKTEIQAEKAKNSKLTEEIKDREQVKAKYQEFPAEFRVLSEPELVEKLNSAKESESALTLIKAKVLLYFEGLLDRKKENEENFKGNLKDFMPKSIQLHFETSELV